MRRRDKLDMFAAVEEIGDSEIFVPFETDVMRNKVFVLHAPSLAWGQQIIHLKREV